MLPDTFSETKSANYLTYRFLNTNTKLAELYRSKWLELSLWPSSLFLPEQFFFFEEKTIYGFLVNPVFRGQMMICSEIKFKNFVDFTGFNMLQNSLTDLLEYESMFSEHYTMVDETFLQFSDALNPGVKMPNFVEYAVFSDFDEGLTFFKKKFFNGCNRANS